MDINRIYRSCAETNQSCALGKTECSGSGMHNKTMPYLEGLTFSKPWFWVSLHLISWVQLTQKFFPSTGLVWHKPLDGVKKLNVFLSSWYGQSSHFWAFAFIHKYYTCHSVYRYNYIYMCMLPPPQRCTFFVLLVFLLCRKIFGAGVPYIFIYVYYIYIYLNIYSSKT